MGCSGSKDAAHGARARPGNRRALKTRDIGPAADHPRSPGPRSPAARPAAAVAIAMTEMPPSHELDQRFASMVEGLGLPPDVRESMLLYSREKKWELLRGQMVRQSEQLAGSTTVDLPARYVEFLRRDMSGAGAAGGPTTAAASANQASATAAGTSVALSTAGAGVGAGGADAAAANADVNDAHMLRSLGIALRTQPVAWVEQFVALDGPQLLVTRLKDLSPRERDSDVHPELLLCFKALLNVNAGRTCVLSNQAWINTFAQSWITRLLKVKTIVAEILGALCLVEGGHRQVLIAMNHLRDYACERIRFQSVVNDLAYDSDERELLMSLRIASMAFVNAVIYSGASKSDLVFRTHLRYEFLMLGLSEIAEKLRQLDNDALNVHLDVFEDGAAADAEELAEHAGVSSALASREPSQMLTALHAALDGTAAYVPFSSVLYHALLIPSDVADRYVHRRRARLRGS